MSLGPFGKPDAMAAFLMNSRVATSKSEGSGCGETQADESLCDYAGGVSPAEMGTAGCQASLEEVSRRAGNQNSGTRSVSDRVSQAGKRGESSRLFLLVPTDAPALILCHCP